MKLIMITLFLPLCSRCAICRTRKVMLTRYIHRKDCIPFHAGAGHIPFERCHNTRSLHSTRHIRATAKLREINNKDDTKHWATLVIFVTVLQRQLTVTLAMMKNYSCIASLAANNLSEANFSTLLK
ncbi:uncharacterized protein BYT42DRAFT_557209 [Radiomyces spectabilis]|uniref:uncharacterized protein n=1 Tax=Radiomyces spectabilis TaxID=64574 RepID=UPI0022204E34|nr:uncharacterized protein BYT42DRAFT_557209 [Radiomyces spectabilis]KAI8391535.1 hypothetical protein BYT42DRAFT_557209 [Radiomyces spectabilis]